MTDLSIHLNRVSPVPLYHQLANQLKAAVEGGQLSKGTFLLNELLLADQWQVSRPTVRRAIQELVDDGLLVRRRGVGTQVVNDQVRRTAALSSLHDDLAAAGRTPRTKVIVLERRVAPAEVCADLGLAAGTEVVHLVRSRSAGSRRLAILDNWLLAEAAATITADELRSKGLYSLLKERGIRPHSASQRLGAKAASVAEAELLGLPPGAPLVTMRRVMQDDTGQAIEVGDHVYDAAHYSVELSVVANGRGD